LDCVFDLGMVAMVEGNPWIERSAKTLVFTSGEPGISPAALIGFAAIFAFAIMSAPTPASVPIAAMFLLVFGALIVNASRRWTTEIDLTTRRIRVSRRSFGRWTNTTLDCPFDECSALGTFEYDTEGHLSYNVYVKLKDGTRHAIPLSDSTLSDAARVASQLSDATGIPRLDIYAGPIYVSPDDDSSRRGN
jgi:hypothetical protein